MHVYPVLFVCWVALLADPTLLNQFFQMQSHVADG
jgi:hypothetical protein